MIDESPRDAARARSAIRTAVGYATFELLVAYLAFIRTAHYWTEMQVIEMLRRPLSEGPAFAAVLERLERVSLDGRLPEPRSECEAELFDALTIMFLARATSTRLR